jgi:hypothetical protein
MGGNCSLTAAGAFPDRFAAVASFHGGNLGTDKPDSPHLFVKNNKAAQVALGGGWVEEGQIWRNERKSPPPAETFPSNLGHNTSRRMRGIHTSGSVGASVSNSRGDPTAHPAVLG